MRTPTRWSHGLACPFQGVRDMVLPDSRSWRTWGRLVRGTGKVMVIMAFALLNGAAVAAVPGGLGPDDRALLATYARDTWRSIDRLGSAGALPADVLRRDAVGDGWVAAGPTS